jgi:hypothetical protein
MTYNDWQFYIHQQVRVQPQLVKLYERLERLKEILKQIKKHEQKN